MFAHHLPHEGGLVLFVIAAVVFATAAVIKVARR